MNWTDILPKFLKNEISNTQETIKDSCSVKELKYEEVIEYFIQEKSKSPELIKGAVLLGPEGLITQVFLDTNNEIVCDSNGKPYGRKIRAISIDDELKDFFDGQELIIFE